MEVTTPPEEAPTPEEVTTPPEEAPTPEERPAPEEVTTQPEEAPAQEVTTPPEEAPKVETTKKTGELDLLNESHKVLHVWKDLYKVEKDNADDAYYYAKQLWCEDKAKWAEGKRKVLRGEWTVEQFDQEMEKLKKRQKPVWDILINQVGQIREKLEGPHKDFHSAHERVKESLGPHPLMKLFGKEIDHSEEHVNLRHEYQNKLKQQFNDAETEFQLLCGWPEGTLTKVKLFRDTYLKENAKVIELVHDKKGVPHDESPPSSE